MSDSNKAAMADSGFIESSADFGLSLLRESVGSNNASAILSPVSIAFALSLAYAGAVGDTRKEFDSKFANKGQSSDALNSFFQQSYKTFTGANKNVTLELANRAFVDKKLDVKQTYKDTITQKLGGDFATVDFGQPTPTAKEINDFVKEKTHNKIDDLIEADAINPGLTKLILINAVYFKGLWRDPFHADATTDAKFFASANDEKQVKMMKRQLKAKYYEDEQLQLVRLPYTDENAELVVYLPRKNNLGAWLKQVNGKQLLDLRSKATQSTVQVSLPRFKIKQTLKLTQTLQKLGFSKAFGNQADLSGISDEALSISDAIHKAFVETNEEGSEAAAATGIIAEVRALVIPVEFTADHSFLFSIFVHDQPLFLGQFTGDI